MHVFFLYLFLNIHFLCDTDCVMCSVINAYCGPSTRHILELYIGYILVKYEAHSGNYRKKKISCLSGILQQTDSRYLDKSSTGVI